MTIPCLLLPGWLNSGPDHWQSRWQRLRPSLQRVDFGEWVQPDPQAWSERLRTAVSGCPTPPLLIAHSLGCLAAAGLVADGDPPPLAGALLVAPPDPARAGTPAAIADFSPAPRDPFRTRGLVVYSSNDPYAEEAFSLSMAEAWGLEPVRIGALGHINAESGLGDWSEGLALLDGLLATARGSAEPLTLA
ncbi:MAG: alpha/beta hydrolase [Cyanobacteriota bacterium]|nr:alpha/beta hydrolase [Cyanobacteriota bacterium]